MTAGCSSGTITAPPLPGQAPTSAPPIGNTVCGCPGCTCDDNLGGCFTCGDRIGWTKNNGANPRRHARQYLVILLKDFRRV